jgi:hypothetical protein
MEQNTNEVKPYLAALRPWREEFLNPSAMSNGQRNFAGTYRGIEFSQRLSVRIGLSLPSAFMIKICPYCRPVDQSLLEQILMARVIDSAINTSILNQLHRIVPSGTTTPVA